MENSYIKELNELKNIYLKSRDELEEELSVYFPALVHLMGKFVKWVEQRSEMEKKLEILQFKLESEEYDDE